LRYQNMVKMKRDAKICNCMHVTKCDKKPKNPKSPIKFESGQGPPHHEDKKVWSHHIYTIGSNKSPFSRGEAQMCLLLFFTFHQIWLNPIPRDHQPTYFTNLKWKTFAGN
jgi:hypothetical protein